MPHEKAVRYLESFRKFEEAKRQFKEVLKRITEVGKNLDEFQKSVNPASFQANQMFSKGTAQSIVDSTWPTQQIITQAIHDLEKASSAIKGEWDSMSTEERLGLEKPPSTV